MIGRSGSGKGTQSELFKEYLVRKGYKDIFYVTTGGGFRKFIESDSHAATLSKELINNGGLGPEFLAIWNWSTIFIEQLKGGETIILDGAPRKVVEVGALHSAITFFGYTKATVIYLDVSEGWAKEKLISRGRNDDASREDQERKMKWFEEDVLPCVDMYMHDPRYSFIHVNGEQSIEDVHKELVAKLEEVQ